MDESIARKLAVPKKASAWEREKQAAEAKKQREDAENAAALRDFQKSFGVDSDEEFPPPPNRGRGPPSGSRDRQGPRRQGPSFAREHSRPRNGPDRLGPVEDQQQPPSLKRKRALDAARENNRRREDSEPSRRTYDDVPAEAEYEAPKPTVYLQSLPPGITLDELKALLSPHLKVHSIRFLERQQSTAIATLTSDTNLSQIENASRVLKDRYLGCGHRLSISRYDESAFNKKRMEPFGATAVNITAPSMRNAPPPDEHDFDRRFNDRRGPRRPHTEVKVNLPLDISTVKAIHTIADRLLAEPDADRAIELEALLMKSPEVQSDAKFSFLFDSSSSAGIYYRYCLWSRGGERREPERIYDDSGTTWDISTQGATFPNLTHLSQVVTDIDYASSDDESDNEDERKRPADRLDPENLLVDNERNFLLPLQHARLTHLLARLPTTNARLRTGDVARITNFAIRHAGNGAQQIVDKLLLNVAIPFATTAAAAYEDMSSDSEDAGSAIEGEAAGKQNDPSGAKLVALYIISDVLSASATAGARNSWKYRQLFEAGFQKQKTFETLGTIDQELGWGRMKMEQWRRKIGVVFDLWEGWSVFSASAMEGLRRSFNNDPEPETVQVEEPTETDTRKPKWMMAKVVEKPEQNMHLAPIVSQAQEEDEANVRVPSSDVGKSEPPQDGDTKLDASTRREEADEPTRDVQDPPPVEPAKASSTNIEQQQQQQQEPQQQQIIQSASSAPKRRMRAEDMFADSDEEGK